MPFIKILSNEIISSNINKIKEVVPWFNRTLQLKMLDNNETEVPVSRSHSKRLKKYLNL